MNESIRDIYIYFGAKTDNRDSQMDVDYRQLKPSIIHEPFEHLS